MRHDRTTEDGGSAELHAVFRQLQDDTFIGALGGACVLGLLVGMLSPSHELFEQHLYLSLALFGTALLAWMAHRWKPIAGIVILIAAGFSLCWAAAIWVELPWTFCLTTLPCGLTMLMISRRLSIVLAILLTAVTLFAPMDFLAVDQMQRSLTVIMLWSLLGMIWLTLRPVLSTAEWAWASYEQARELLTRMGETQVELKQALANAQHANVQLTRMNRLADGLRQAAEDARRIKEQFVANVSHELRTPLNMIIGFSEMIVNQPRMYGERIPSALLADLDVVLRNSRHLASLIDDVLDLSQIEADRMALTKERVRLDEVIASAVTAVKGLFLSKNLSLCTEVEAGLPEVFCDHTRIREVVLNLLSNAGRFTESGGAIVRAVRRDNDVVVSVIDTGPGISAADAEKLFRPFQQVDGSMRRRYGGSGLGLAISKSFVELHEGTMWMESTPGVGTVIAFSLPIDPPLPITGSATRWLAEDWTLEARLRSTSTPPVIKPRLVVLESHDILQRILRRYLADFDIVGVSSVDDVRREIAEAPAHAVLVNDGDSEGPTWRQRLLTTGSVIHDTPIFSCAVPGPPNTSELIGATGYLVKPVLLETIVAALDHALGSAQETPSGHAATVLIVDDEPDALRLFWRMLSGLNRNYRVLTASDSRQALEILRMHRPDVVFMDLVMPDADGFWLLNEIRRTPEFADIPTYVVSARDPSGQPIVSDALMVMKSGGLSLSQLIACLQQLTGILSPMRQSVNQGASAVDPA
jgi:signal transduction histidine kinase/CheY-like chemotaxis protein